MFRVGLRILGRASLSPSLALLTAFLVILLGHNTQAASPDWTCNLNFTARGTDIQFIIGYSKVVGRGDLVCSGSTGATFKQSVRVTLGTPVVFPRISFSPSITIDGEAQGITLYQRSPDTLLDTYLTVDIRVVRNITTIQLSHDNKGLNFDLNLKGVAGFGFAIGGTVVTID